MGSSDRNTADEDPEIAGIRLRELPQLAGALRTRNQAAVARLKKVEDELLDRTISAAHSEQFRTIDCLECAHCCKTTPALVVQEDIDRISRHLKMSAGDFIRQYVAMDEDGDFVLNRTPCSFLEATNACAIYAVRPAACRAFPLTDLPGQKAILEITFENTAVCPAVYRIVEKLDTIFPA